MSVEPSELMSEAWTQWQGHVVNGKFSLRRYLGSSDRSAVFLTELAARDPSAAALKLIPDTAGTEDPQRADWSASVGLAHPHLVRLLETGRCELDGMPYLYAVMEYADQSLVEVLRKRALTEDEAREMLLPTLNALGYLHNGNLVQGRLKPSNVLAVGDQLKLACDTVRRVGQPRPSSHAASIYDPPETWQEGYAAAADIWALGVTLFEALTRSLPSGLDERRGVVPLPMDFPPAFREIVAACLSRRPFDRPKVSEIEAWLRRPSGQSLSARSAPQTAPRELAAREKTPREAPPREPPSRQATPREAIPYQPTPREPTPREPTTLREPVLRELALRELALRESAAREPVAPQHAAPVPRMAESVVASPAAPSSPRPQRAMSREQLAEFVRELAQRFAGYATLIQKAAALVLSKGRALAPAIVGVALALAWMGINSLRTHRNPTAPAAPTVQAAPAQAPREAPRVAPPASASRDMASTKAGSIARAAPVKAGAPTSAMHEVLPDVPRSARGTIRGHIKVYVRVIVDPDGTVYAALADRKGPSRYFERLSIEAAKKWTFPAVDTEAQRLVQVRFDFSRGGTTAHAVTVK